MLVPLIFVEGIYMRRDSGKVDSSLFGNAPRDGTPEI